MKYTYKFYLNNEIYKNFFFDDVDLKQAVSFWIVRAMDAINYELTVEKAGEVSVVRHIWASLLSDLNKSLVLEDFFKKFQMPVAALKFGTISELFDLFKLFAKEAGFNLVIEEVKPNIVPSLVSFALSSVIQHKHIYAGQIKKLPINFFRAHPELYTDPKDYMRCRLNNLLMTFAQNKVESNFILRLSSKLKDKSVSLYRSIHQILTEADYKTTFTPKMRSQLSAPLTGLMNKLYKNEISDVEFAVQVEKVFQSYIEKDSELKCLLRLTEIASESENPAEDLHAYLKANQSSEKLRATLRPLLIAIITDYKKFKVENEAGAKLPNKAMSK